jgi:hypothetical protein
VSFSPLDSYFVYSEILNFLVEIYRYVAFARDSKHIAAGVNNGARVIYGDGGKVLSLVSARQMQVNSTFSYSKNYSLSFWSARQGSWRRKPNCYSDNI